MSSDDRETEPSFGLDMDFGQALERFIGTRPVEVEESIERSKTKKPPGDQIPRRLPRVARQTKRARKSEPVKSD